MEKLRNLWKSVRQANGVFGAMYKFWRMDTLKFGDLVGVDKYGNKYYQNNYYFYGKNRWVEYNDKVFFDYDASQVPAEWHNWLHYMTDDPPTTNPRVQYKWMIDHTENFSGTNRQYVPYSTVKQKITQWQPKDGQKIKYNVK